MIDAQLKTIKAGTYRFNDELSVPDSRISANIHFEVLPYTGEWTQEHSDELMAEEGIYIPAGTYTVTYSYSDMAWILPTDDMPDLNPFFNYGKQIAKVEPYNANAEEWLSGNATEFYHVGAGWDSRLGEDNQTITVLEDTTVSEEFYTWFNSNTTTASETGTVDINYNGSQVGSLTSGQSATFCCAGKVMGGDIIVTLNADATMTYDGMDTALTSGQVVTIPCAGKVMKTDLVITV